MKLTIFGATGGIGRQLLELAIPAGHELTAVVRDPSKLSVDVRVIQADLARPDPEALETAVDGGDAVLSALGPRTREDSGIAEKGTRAMVRAMQATGARRLVVVSAARSVPCPPPTARCRASTTQGTASSCGTSSLRSCRPCSESATRTWRGWRTWFATAASTGPSCVRST